MKRTKSGLLHQHSAAYQKTLEHQVAPPAELAEINIRVAIGLLEDAARVWPVRAGLCEAAIVLLRQVAGEVRG